jgi:hypothetical protein
MALIPIQVKMEIGRREEGQRGEKAGRRGGGQEKHAIINYKLRNEQT